MIHLFREMVQLIEIWSHDGRSNDDEMRLAVRESFAIENAVLVVLTGF